jgi:hypothetical protein
VNFHSNPSKQDLEPEKSNLAENGLDNHTSVTNNINGNLAVKNFITIEEIMKNSQWMAQQEPPDAEID